MVLQLRQRISLFVGDVAIEKIAVPIGAGHVLEIDELRAANLAEQLLVFGERDAHLLGDLAFGRGPAELLLELGDGRFDRTLVLASAAREVVVAAQLVEHGAADALRREGLKLRSEEHTSELQSLTNL